MTSSTTSTTTNVPKQQKRTRIVTSPNCDHIIVVHKNSIEIKNEKKKSSSSWISTSKSIVTSDVGLTVLGKIVPPVPVYLKTGLSKQLAINSGLCLLGGIPATIHAWYIIYKNSSSSTTTTSGTDNNKLKNQDSENSNQEQQQQKDQNQSNDEENQSEVAAQQNEQTQQNTNNISSQPQMSEYQFNEKQ